MLTLDEAIRKLREDPQHADLVRDAYLGPDTAANALRFSQSAEFAATLELLGRNPAGLSVLDIGAGTGIASFAFAQHGARVVYALEPDGSDLVGFGALKRLRDSSTIQMFAGIAEAIPLRSSSVDVVYGRQVLHHVTDLPTAMREVYRVLRPGGVFIACREHVISGPEDLAAFLAQHPVHKMAGGENAYLLTDYMSGIKGAGLTLMRVLDPWDSVINAFPAVESQRALADLPRSYARRRFGSLASLIVRLPGAKRYIWKRIKRPSPGNMYSFVARKA